MALSKYEQADRVFFRDTTDASEDVMASFQRTCDQQRYDGIQKQKTNQMLITGTGSFLAQKQLQHEKDTKRRENADTTNQFAKMRFNISLEKAKQAEIEKQLEEKDILEAIERRQISEANKRRKDI